MWWTFWDLNQSMLTDEFRVHPIGLTSWHITCFLVFILCSLNIVQGSMVLGVGQNLVIFIKRCSSGMDYI